MPRRRRTALRGSTVGGLGAIRSVPDSTSIPISRNIDFSTSRKLTTRITRKRVRLQAEMREELLVEVVLREGAEDLGLDVRDLRLEEAPIDDGIDGEHVRDDLPPREGRIDRHAQRAFVAPRQLRARGRLEPLQVVLGVRHELRDLRLELRPELGDLLRRQDGWARHGSPPGRTMPDGGRPETIACLEAVA